MVKSRTKKETVGLVSGPCSSLRRGIVYDNVGAESGNWVSGEVIRLLVETFIRRDQWIGAPWMQEVVRYICLWQNCVPDLERHAWISEEEACNIVSVFCRGRIIRSATLKCLLGGTYSMVTLASFRMKDSRPLEVSLSNLWYCGTW